MQRHAATLGCKTAEQATKDLTFLCYTHSRVTSCSQTLRTGLCKPLPKISLYLISSWPAVKAETPSRGPLPSDLFLFLLPLSILLKRDSSSLPLSISVSAKAPLSSICTLYVHSLFFCQVSFAPSGGSHPTAKLSKWKQEGNSLQAACCLPTQKAVHPQQSPSRQGCNGNTATSVVGPLEMHREGVTILIPEAVSGTPHCHSTQGLERLPRREQGEKFY